MQKGKYLSEKNPLTPCSMSIIPEEAKSMCYVYLTPHLFEAAQVNMNEMTPEGITRAFASCDRIPNESHRQICYGGFGKEFVGLAQNRDIRNVENMKEEQLQKVIDWCSYAIKNTAITACHEHAIQSLYWGGENKPQAAILFCTLMTETSHQEACFRQLVSAVRQYQSAESQENSFCSQIPKQHQYLCKENS